MTCRALHDSLVNHGQGDPELILTLYEEIAGDLPLAVGSACGSSTSTERARMVRRGIAALTRVDALDFRLRRLTNPRGLGVLRAMAARMGWPPRPSPRPAAPGAAVLPGRGLAYVHYKHDETIVAMGMEVEVERASGRIRVTRVVCVQDCGLVINPDNVRSQVEGNVLQTLSRALHGDVVFDRQRVTTVDWASYPILTFPEAPALDIELIQRLGEPPGARGGGGALGGSGAPLTPQTN